MTEKLTTKETEGIFNVTSDVVLQNQGVAHWTSEVYKHFRVEWRETAEDLEYNFYHHDGPNPIEGFEEGRTRIDERGNEVVAVDHGQPVSLPDFFEDLLAKVADYVFEDKGVKYTIEFFPETFSFRLHAIGGARSLMTRNHFTKSLFIILDANFPN